MIKPIYLLIQKLVCKSENIFCAMLVGPNTNLLPFQQTCFGVNRFFQFSSPIIFVNRRINTSAISVEKVGLIRARNSFTALADFAVHLNNWWANSCFQTILWTSKIPIRNEIMMKTRFSRLHVPLRNVALFTSREALWLKHFCKLQLRRKKVHDS